MSALSRIIPSTSSIQKKRHSPRRSPSSWAGRKPEEKMLDDTNKRVSSDRPRLVIAVNSSIAIGFLQGQLEYFQDRGFDATVLSPDRRKGEWEVARPEGVPIIEVPMEREISPIRDLVSFWRLWCVMG